MVTSNMMKIKKADGTNFTIGDNYRPVRNGLAYVFHEGRLSTSSGTEKESNKKQSPV